MSWRSLINRNSGAAASRSTAGPAPGSASPRRNKREAIQHSMHAVKCILHTLQASVVHVACSCPSTTWHGNVPIPHQLLVPHNVAKAPQQKASCSSAAETAPHPASFCWCSCWCCFVSGLGLCKHRPVLLRRPTFSYSFMKYCRVPLRLYPLAKVGASSMHLGWRKGAGKGRQGRMRVSAGGGWPAQWAHVNRGCVE
jgi:hypothetical protein